LGIFSRKKGLPDGMGLNIAGGQLAAQREAAALGISVSAYVAQRRSATGNAVVEHNASLSRGQRNSNMGITSRNAAVRDLGEEVGAFVMGQDDWKTYIETPTAEMPPLDRPFSANVTKKLTKERPSGARNGWKFDHVDRSEPRWSMTDKVTYRRPNHTQEVPDLVEETLQAAISGAYHHNWTLHSRLLKRNKKDKDAGKQLSRSSLKLGKK